MNNKVWVRWFDGYLEEFEATEVRFGSDLLWMRLENGENRHIPLRQVRWFGLEKESHANLLCDSNNSNGSNTGTPIGFKQPDGEQKEATAHAN